MKQLAWALAFVAVGFSSLAGQSRLQVSGFLNFQDPLDFQNIHFTDANGNSISYDGKNWRDLTPSIALGFWSRNGWLLNEIEFTSKKWASGSGQGWSLDLQDTTGNPSFSIKNRRISMRYGFFPNVLPASHRLAFFPGIGFQPYFKTLKLTTSAPPANFQNNQKIGAEISILPRLMYRVYRGFFVDFTIQMLKLKYETYKSESQNFKFSGGTTTYDSRIGIVRLGVGYRFGWGK